MNNLQKKSPTFKLKDLALNSTTELTLSFAKARATGETQYGKWFLWIVELVDQTVSDKDTGKTTNHYSGEAVLFTDKEMNDLFEKFTNTTQDGVKVKITVSTYQTQDGKVFRKYNAELASAGVSAPNSLPFNYSKFIEDYKGYVTSGAVGSSKDDFVLLAMSASYKIPLDRIEKIWSVYNEQK